MTDPLRYQGINKKNTTTYDKSTCIKTCPFNITACNKTNKRTIWEKYSMTKKVNEILNDVTNNHQM
jgi:hypothetical protein